MENWRLEGWLIKVNGLLGGIFRDCVGVGG